jgi:hypothetical protein
MTLIAKMTRWVNSGDSSPAFTTDIRLQHQQFTDSDRTPLARMLPSVMGMSGAGNRVMSRPRSVALSCGVIDREQIERIDTQSSCRCE